MTVTSAIRAAVGPGGHADSEHLVAVHVGSEQLAGLKGDDRPEAQLARTLGQFTPAAPPRLYVHGEAGAGKTSLILRALAQANAWPGPVESLILRCGEDRSSLASVTAFIRYLAATMGSQRGFGSVDVDRLAKAAATGVDVVPASDAHSLAFGGGTPFTYKYDWQPTIETLRTEASAEEQRQLIVDTVTEASEKTRLVVVLDDTDRFAATRSDGTMDVESIDNLFRHGVGFLLELPVAVVVAIHPSYDEVRAVRDMAERGGFADVEVPLLPNRTPPALAVVLDRRLEVAGLSVRSQDIFAPEALAQLQAVYFEGRRRDLRLVLRLCEQSARRAARENAERVTILHVQDALQGLGPS